MKSVIFFCPLFFSCIYFYGVDGAGVAPLPPKNCPENEIWNACGGCEKTCTNSNPICPSICSLGKCRCAPGFVRLNGTCILEDSCPGTETRKKRQTNNCTEKQCQPGYKCVMNRIMCIRAPCPSIAICIAENNTENLNFDKQSDIPLFTGRINPFHPGPVILNTPTPSTDLDRLKKRSNDMPKKFQPMHPGPVILNTPLPPSTDLNIN